MAIKKESGRQRSKAISILETIQNQEYRTAGDTNSENLFFRQRLEWSTQ
jgi:hypothetical protein